MSCLGEDAILELVSSELRRSGLPELEAHLDACERCRRLVSAVVSAEQAERQAAPAPTPTPVSRAAPPSTSAPAPLVPLVHPLPAGSQVGHYRLVEPLGTGSMAAVYVALDPLLGRRVAVKMLRGGTDLPGPDEARRRMLREAKALARVSHPNVISVFEAGECNGEVFLAMELVDGDTLTSFLGRPGRSLRQILAVFVQAGRGLAAAHAAGLTHRDFKPDNVLVGRDGRVRVTDFGLAGLAGSIPPEALRSAPVAGVLALPTAPLDRVPAVTDVRLTRTGVLLGTPAYMAPEQHLGRPADPRSDQFAFCVALYEALVGRRPFRGQSYDELASSVLRGAVERPGRRAAPAWLLGLLRRGLRVSARDRFPSMEALLRELERPHRPRYGRWISLAAALVLGAAGAAAMRHAQREQGAHCQDGAPQLGGIWDPGRRQAMRQAFLASGAPAAEAAFGAAARALDAYARGLGEMQVEACEATAVRHEQSPELLAVQKECLSDRLAELKAQTDLFVGADARTVGRAVSAAGSLTRLDGCAPAALLRARVPPPEPALRQKVDALRARLASAKVLHDTGRYAEGLPLAREIAASAERLGYLPLQGESLYLVGFLENDAGDARSAEKTLKRALLAAEAGRHDALAANAWTLLVWVVGTTEARYDEGEEFARHAQAAIERLGGSEEHSARLHYVVGSLLEARGRYAEALERHQKALAIWERLLGPEHSTIALAENSIGSILRKLGRFDEALAAYGRALAILEKTLGPDHPYVGTTHNNIGTVYQSQGRYALALPEHERARAIWEKTLGPAHPDVGAALNNRADALRALGRYREALADFERALGIWEKALGPSHPYVGHASTGIGLAELGLGLPKKAIAPLARALALRPPRPGDPTERAETEFALARALMASGQARARARTLAREAEQAYAKVGDRGAKELVAVRAWLGGEGGRK